MQKKYIVRLSKEERNTLREVVVVQFGRNSRGVKGKLG